MEKEIIKHLSLILRSNKVESGPPLSTILGNFGINTVKFVKDFNEFTKDLPDYFLLEVHINIYNDRTYEFFFKNLNISLFLNLVSFNKEFLVKGSGGYKPQKYKVIKLQDIIYISILKFGFCNNRILNLIFGSINSMGLIIIK